eukprot:TRINITY_DN25148_c0_g1_i2.p1 TRINITY_DN25148_c0_g1~~TRINITY_DN25148_c0_g1_i2.p1  ORF type:complete len:467 (-),score=27.52 TRINITY_DN25148_c0_g1_i2:91-1491(-)
MLPSPVNPCRRVRFAISACAFILVSPALGFRKRILSNEPETVRSYNDLFDAKEGEKSSSESLQVHSLLEKDRDEKGKRDERITRMFDTRARSLSSRMSLQQAFVAFAQHKGTSNMARMAKTVDMSDVKHYAHRIGDSTRAAVFYLAIFAGLCIACVSLYEAVRYRKLKALRSKWESLQINYPRGTDRLPLDSLFDGMSRLDQERRLSIRQHVMAQSTMTSIPSLSAQTPNRYEVVSENQETIFNCCEISQLQAAFISKEFDAKIGLAEEQRGDNNLEKTFRCAIGMPQINLEIPDNRQEISSPRRAIDGIPCIGSAFLYASSERATTCCSRPHVAVFDVRDDSKKKLGIITDSFSCCDAELQIQVFHDATEQSTLALTVRGQLGTSNVASMCCGGHSTREALFEVLDPQASFKTVAFMTKGWYGGCEDSLTYADMFIVDFGEVSDARYKAMLVAVALYLDYRIFGE